ncbi:MAG TPA: undecaprenyldiphospho-muramoylpentapeptide beta-N-acetylglucosaminyltransferase [Acidimicrobiia bacterium]|nr:undecaprenyldiphospho-muramoylpentapeptide beta-N-acetylglucosaminyltransferase [Acidimicrobiia bacterium]
MTRAAEPDGEVFAVITGGGTGGHVYPALALADALVARRHPRGTIRFVGARRGLEARVVPEAGYAIDLLPGRGLQRRLTAANLRAGWDTLTAFVRARRILREMRPDVVVGVGGYASLPCLVAARLRRVPTLVHEQNAAPGLANRVAVRMGARAAVSLPGTPLRHAALTGNPVRDEIAAVQRDPDRARPLVTVFGGSLGAGTLNDAAMGLYDRWRDRTDVAVHHVTGPRNHEECAARLAAARRPGDSLHYELVGYEDHMEQLYARTTLAVCRAGAITVAELAAAAVPAVLVPLPGAPGDHQTRNAEALVDAGAAVVVADAECDATRLDAELRGLLADAGRLERMSTSARALGRPDAAARLAELVEEVASGRQ